MSASNEAKIWWGPKLSEYQDLAVEGVLTPEQLDAFAISRMVQYLTDQIDKGETVQTPQAGESNSSRYDSSGKLLTVNQNISEEAEVERTRLVRKAFSKIPNYVPPPTFRWYHRTQAKVFVPVYSYPGINFVGQLLGPRGKTLQRMQESSGAKIAIRGRGSTRTGGRTSGHMGNGSIEEDLHCVVTADTEESLELGIAAVEETIRLAVIPEEDNDHKRDQLRELASLNGTLRADTRPYRSKDEINYSQAGSFQAHKEPQASFRAPQENQAMPDINRLNGDSDPGLMYKETAPPGADLPDFSLPPGLEKLEANDPLLPPAPPPFLDDFSTNASGGGSPIPPPPPPVSLGESEDFELPPPPPPESAFAENQNDKLRQEDSPLSPPPPPPPR